MNPDPKFLDEYALGWAADKFLEQPCAETEMALLGELYAQIVNPANSSPYFAA